MVSLIIYISTTCSKGSSCCIVRTLLGLPLFEPLGDELDFVSLDVDDALWWQFCCCFIRKQSILVPMVDSFWNQPKRILNGVGSVRQSNGMRRGLTPGVPFSIDNCHARVAKVEAAMLVDDLDISGLSDVKGLDTNGLVVWNINGSRD